MMAKITPAQLDITAKNYQQALAQGAGEAKKITDKLLTNYFFLGLINLLFPNAKVIHTRCATRSTPACPASPSCSRTTCRTATTSASSGAITASIAS